MARHTIILKDPEKVTYDEAVAAGTITPGDLVEKDTNGKVVRHATADGATIPMFALEEGWSTGAGAAIDTDYASLDTVQLGVCARGVVVNAWVAAAASAIVIDDPLGSDGAGGLKKITVGAGTLEGALIGYADVALDNSGGGSRARLRVRVA